MSATLIGPLLRGSRPALWCWAGGTTHGAGGRVVLRDGPVLQAARALARAGRVTEQALVPLRRGDLVVTLEGDRTGDGPSFVQVQRVLDWSPRTRPDGRLDALIIVERVLPGLVQRWLTSDEATRFWRGATRYHNRTWPLASAPATLGTSSQPSSLARLPGGLPPVRVGLAPARTGASRSNPARGCPG